MNKAKHIGLIILLILLSFNVLAQNKAADRLSFSISWAPEYWGPNDGEFRLDAVLPFSFESLIHYKTLKRLSFSTGLGYQRSGMSGFSWPANSVIDVNKSFKWVFNDFRIPVQAYFHFSENNSNVNTYLKTEFTNVFTFHKSIYYENEIISSTKSNTWYSSTNGLGIGSILRANKSIGVLIEGSLGTILDKDILFQMYIVTLKLGIVLQ